MSGIKAMARLILPACLGAAALALILFAGKGREPSVDFPAGSVPDTGERTGALVDEVVFVQESDLGKGVELIERGVHHASISGITNAALYRRVRYSPKLDYDYSYGMSIELTINPAGPVLEDGSLNPFSSRRVREAMNLLIDRHYIAEEIFGGLAVPRFLPLNTAFPDYARLAKTARALELRYAYDPCSGRSTIEEEMFNLGGELSGGRWFYGGAPVRLKVLIRTEDDRRRLGEYISLVLENLGFRVDRIYRTAEESSRIWIAGDPRAGQWHVYTGGWVSVIIQRDLAGNFDFYYTPRGRPEPLWQVYSPDEKFDEIAGRLQRRDYEDWDERQALMEEALGLAMEDSVRIWVADALKVWPRGRSMEVAADLAGGLSGSALWPYTVRFVDRAGGRVVFGAPNLLGEPWNPVDGTSWIFDQAIMRALGDPEFLPDPFTGLYLPQRVESALVTLREGISALRTHDWLEIEHAPEIQVPEEAWIDWDASAERFITVGEKHPGGISARARVRIRYESGYFDRLWHDGSRVSPADVVIGWLLSFERSKEDSPLYDRAHTVGFQAFQRHYRGWRIISLEPLELEVYSDQVFPDAEWIAAARAPSAAPWHTLAVAILAEKNNDLAFSSDKADRLQIDWMHFVSGPSLRIMEQHLNNARASGFLPFEGVMSEFIRAGEVEARYESLARWFAARNHFWVGSGPFYLHSVHPVERSVVLRRFEDFPDPSCKWLHLTRPQIPVLELEGPMVVVKGEAAVFQLRVFANGRPYPAEDITGISYVLFDSDNRPVREGAARRAGGEQDAWEIALTAEEIASLGTGANILEVMAASARVALPGFASHAFATVPR